MGLKIEKIRAILFDIDGTLSDTDDRMVEKVSSKLTLIIRDDVRRESLARWMVMVVESPGNLLYTMADRFGLDSLLMRYFQWMRKRKPKKAEDFRLIDGVREMLAALSSYELGIVSARDEETTNAFLDQYSLRVHFKVIVTAQTCRYTKPLPDPMLYAAEKLGLRGEDCLMVGDTTVDMKAAKRAGMQAVGVLCGFGRERELQRAGADVILPSTVDVIKLFS